MTPLPSNLSQEQIKDAGLALLLILLLAIRLGKQTVLFWPAIAVLLIIMTWPNALKPWARLWFGLSSLLSTVASKIILSLVFFLVATPIGYVRRLLGADAMRLKEWRSGDKSVFVVRQHTYCRKDLEHPF